MTIRRLFILAIAALLLGIAIGVIWARAASAAPADPCDPVESERCCACEPSEAAEPAPQPRIYLPAVMQRLPGMSAEFTPYVPAPTVTPEVSGDVAR